MPKGLFIIVSASDAQFTRISSNESQVQGRSPAPSTKYTSRLRLSSLRTWPPVAEQLGQVEGLDIAVAAEVGTALWSAIAAGTPPRTEQLSEVEGIHNSVAADVPRATAISDTVAIAIQLRITAKFVGAHVHNIIRMFRRSFAGVWKDIPGTIGDN